MKTMTMTITIDRTPRTLKLSDGTTMEVEELGTLLPMTRKPAHLGEVGGYGRHRIYVTQTVQLTSDEFDEFASSLLRSRDWLAGKGGSATDGVHTGVLCVEVTAPGRPYLYVNPEGGDYARYASRLG